MSNPFSDYKPPSAATLTKKTLKNLVKYGPELARTQQKLQEELEPQNQALQASLFERFAPFYSQIGTDLSNKEALSNAETARQIADLESVSAIKRDLENITGQGGDLVDEALNLDKLANPEFYKSRETVNAGLQALISGQDPNKLSGAELANIERGINRLNARTGNLNTGDATTTAANAMVFGDELNKKRDRFGAALNLFPGISSASRSPIDTFQIGAGRGSFSQPLGTQNVGNNQFQFNPQQGSNIQRFGETAITPLVQQKYDIMAGRRTGADFFNQTNQATVGSVCCFIMIAANDGKELPWYVRFCRDYYYERNPEVAKGYKKMAKWLVPLMKQYSSLRVLIKYTMYNPITAYGGYLMGENRYGKYMRPIKNFWFKVWRTL